MNSPHVKPNTLVLFIILFTFFVWGLTCIGIGFTIRLMHKLTGHSHIVWIGNSHLFTLRWVQSSL